MGKIASIKLTFGNGNKSVFMPGESVFGNVSVTVTKTAKLKVITAYVYGHCKVRWSVSSGTGNDRRTTVYKSKEDYISLVLILWKGENNRSFKLNPGDHKKNFSFNLPSNCPSSFNGKYGSVTYSITVKCVFTGLSSDRELVRNFNIYDKVDLSQQPRSAELFYQPIRLKKTHENSCCFCFCRSAVKVDISLNRKAYSPGDEVLIDGSVDNASAGDLQMLLILFQKTTWFGKRSSSSDHFHTKEKVLELARWKGNRILQHTVKNYQNTPTIKVPLVVASQLRNCNFIDVQYFMTVRFLSRSIWNDDVLFNSFATTIAHRSIPDFIPVPDLPPSSTPALVPTAPTLEEPLDVHYAPTLAIGGPGMTQPDLPPSYLEATRDAGLASGDYVNTMERSALRLFNRINA